ncbi:hypothetical protein HK105_201945 [Polyrhizophydium stewartii]|uniref:Uncharacterized protein n=1 Tax=Polyrhizophydium stewartii TaxID=2732419 RepID=A0ABR4NGE5_9FUNG
MSRPGASSSPFLPSGGGAAAASSSAARSGSRLSTSSSLFDLDLGGPSSLMGDGGGGGGFGFADDLLSSFGLSLDLGGDASPPSVALPASTFPPPPQRTPLSPSSNRLSVGRSSTPFDTRRTSGVKDASIALDFEKMLSSSETKKLTSTPERMRHIEVKGVSDIHLEAKDAVVKDDSLATMLHRTASPGPGSAAAKLEDDLELPLDGPSKTRKQETYWEFLRTTGPEDLGPKHFPPKPTPSTQLASPPSSPMPPVLSAAASSSSLSSSGTSPSARGSVSRLPSVRESASARDLDGDDDDLDGLLDRPGRKKEEMSFAEFLRTEPPPPPPAKKASASAGGAFRFFRSSSKQASQPTVEPRASGDRPSVDRLSVDKSAPPTPSSHTTSGGPPRSAVSSIQLLDAPRRPDSAPPANHGRRLSIKEVMLGLGALDQDFASVLGDVKDWSDFGFLSGIGETTTPATSTPEKPVASSSLLGPTPTLASPSLGRASSVSSAKSPASQPPALPKPEPVAEPPKPATPAKPASPAKPVEPAEAAPAIPKRLSSSGQSIKSELTKPAVPPRPSVPAKAAAEVPAAEKAVPAIPAVTTVAAAAVVAPVAAPVAAKRVQSAELAVQTDAPPARSSTATSPHLTLAQLLPPAPVIPPKPKTTEQGTQTIAVKEKPIVAAAPAAAPATAAAEVEHKADAVAAPAAEPAASEPAEAAEPAAEPLTIDTSAASDITDDLPTPTPRTISCPNCASRQEFVLAVHAERLADQAIDAAMREIQKKDASTQYNPPQGRDLRNHRLSRLSQLASEDDVVSVTTTAAREHPINMILVDENTRLQQEVAALRMALSTERSKSEHMKILKEAAEARFEQLARVAHRKLVAAMEDKRAAVSAAAAAARANASLTAMATKSAQSAGQSPLSTKRSSVA